MAKFTLRNPVEAVRWWKQGDHPEVHEWNTGIFGVPTRTCLYCHQAYSVHGEVHSYTVCPGDWVIDDTEAGVILVMRHSLFEKRYQPLIAPCNKESDDDRT